MAALCVPAFNAIILISSSGGEYPQTIVNFRHASLIEANKPGQQI